MLKFVLLSSKLLILKYVNYWMNKWAETPRCALAALCFCTTAVQNRYISTFQNTISDRGCQHWLKYNVSPPPHCFFCVIPHPYLLTVVLDFDTWGKQLAGESGAKKVSRSGVQEARCSLSFTHKILYSQMEHGKYTVFREQTEGDSVCAVACLFQLFISFLAWQDSPVEYIYLLNKIARSGSLTDRLAHGNILHSCQ